MLPLNQGIIKSRLHQQGAQYSSQFRRQQFNSSCRRSNKILLNTASSSKPNPESPENQKQLIQNTEEVDERASGLVGQFKSIFSPLKDKEANKKVVALAAGQMLTSIGTLIHDSFLPIYFKDVLKLSNANIGDLQALSQLLCQFMKGISGVIGDILKSQEKVLLFGFFLTLLCKPMFAFSNYVYAVFGATACVYWLQCGKILDRLSKGIREAPSKALMSQTAKSVGERADSVFSLRLALATLGALSGSLIATVVFKLTNQNYATTFLVASIPSLFAFLWLYKVFGSSATATPAPSDQSSTDETPTSPIQKIRTLLSAFKPAYWQALIVVFVLYFGRFDFTFVTLRAKLIIDKSFVPLLSMTVSLVTSMTALFTSSLAKKGDVKFRNKLLLVGFLLLTTANIILSSFNTVYSVILGCIFIGTHMGVTHGLTLSMIGSYIPNTSLPGLGVVTGSAWSFTDVVLGLALGFSNSIAGRLADKWEGIGCFYGGGVASIMAFVLLLIFTKYGALGEEAAEKAA